MEIRPTWMWGEQVITWHMKNTIKFFNTIFILERQLFISFFANKLKMNPLKDPTPKVFIAILKQWITTQSLTKTMVDTLILENYYKC
jgi:hypothetical protein